MAPASWQKKKKTHRRERDRNWAPSWQHLLEARFLLQQVLEVTHSNPEWSQEGPL